MSKATEQKPAQKEYSTTQTRVLVPWMIVSHLTLIVAAVVVTFFSTINVMGLVKQNVVADIQTTVSKVQGR